jgi:putative membrane protein
MEMDLQPRALNTAPNITENRGLKWWEKGTRPDYRFSLANERTFLAWIRTSLAIVAGAIGIDQFASHLGSAHLRLALSLVLLIVGGMLGGVAYTRWARAERAMRHDADLPLSRLLPFMAAFTALLSVALGGLIIVFG